MKQTPIKLQKRAYSEAVLVDRLCSDKQKAAYAKNGHFASSNYRKLFLKTLSAYCEYEYDPKARLYTITEVFDTPKTKEEERLHGGIYQHLAPLILREVLRNHDENHKLVLPVFRLARQIRFVNDNYDRIRYNERKIKATLDIPIYRIHEFYRRVDSRIDDYLRRCIKYLVSVGCIGAEDIHMIQTYDMKSATVTNTMYVQKEKDLHVASENEIVLYKNLKQQASDESGAESNREQWYGRKAEKFRKSLEKLMTKNEIDFMCRGYELWYIDKDKCRALLDEFVKEMPLSEHAQVATEMFQETIVTNARERETKKAHGDDYVKHFEILSVLTVLGDVGDLSEKYGLKSQELLVQEQYGDKRIVYRETRKQM